MCGGDTEIGFDEAYEYLKANSELLVRTQEGKTEVWETNDCLLTVVNLVNTRTKQEAKILFRRSYSEKEAQIDEIQVNKFCAMIIWHDPKVPSV